MIKVLPFLLLLAPVDWESSLDKAKEKAGKTGQRILIEFRVNAAGSSC